MRGVVRGLRNLARLVEIVLTLARYDALFPLERVGGAMLLVMAKQKRLALQKPSGAA